MSLEVVNRITQVEEKGREIISDAELEAKKIRELVDNQVKEIAMFARVEADTIICEQINNAPNKVDDEIKKINVECQQKIDQLNGNAKKNMDKAVKVIMEKVAV